MKKYSKQRQLVYESLKTRKDHPTVEMIYQDLKKENPSIGIATVYRNVSELCEDGKVKRIKTKDASDRYDGNDMKHIHMECNNCHEIFDIKLDDTEDKNLDNEFNKMLKSIDAQLLDHEIWLTGLCAKCKK